MREQPAGFRAFVLVWAGQVVSLLGSAMTWFAFTIWAYQITGEATALALLSFFAFGPALLLSPVAGVVVDRWPRKRVMILSDVTAALGTAVVLVLHMAGSLQIWHLYVVGMLAGAFQVFQYPAYAASITLMVPKEQYARASGMLEMAHSAPIILAPLLAGSVLGIVGVDGIMIFDLFTFAFAITILLVVQVPEPCPSERGGDVETSLWGQSLYGFRYIMARPGLLRLQLLYATGNLLDYTAFVLFAPMLLARTAGQELVLGTVQSVGAAAGLAGAVVLSAWGGPKRRIHGVLIGWMLSSAGLVVMGIGQIVPVWLVAGAMYAFFEPIVNGSDQAIWQAKVEPGAQGRVFASQSMITQIAMPAAMLVAGPLADYVFEPALMPGGALAAPLGWLVGVGPGAGMGLMIAMAGVMGIFVPLFGYLLHSVRNIESVMPDYGTVPTQGAP